MTNDALEHFNTGKASPARVYDYLLGGGHNFGADRELAQQYLAAVPDIEVMARANRAFLRRAVKYLVGRGIRQFLDLGSGIPTVGNVHEVADKAAEAIGTTVRVVYVDLDPVAVAHSNAILADHPHATAIEADLRDPDRVVELAAATGLIHLDRPLAVLLVSVLHFLTDADDPWAVTGRLRELVVPRSFLALSHASTAHHPAEMERLRQLANRAGTSGGARSRNQILQLLQGWQLIEPGLTWTAAWRPEPGDPADLGDEPERAGLLAAVARKPATLPTTTPVAGTAVRDRAIVDGPTTPEATSGAASEAGS